MPENQAIKKEYTPEELKEIKVGKSLIASVLYLCNIMKFTKEGDIESDDRFIEDLLIFFDRSNWLSKETDNNINQFLKKKSDVKIDITKIINEVKLLKDEVLIKKKPDEKFRESKEWLIRKLKGMLGVWETEILKEQNTRNKTPEKGSLNPALSYQEQFTPEELLEYKTGEEAQKFFMEHKEAIPVEEIIKLINCKDRGINSSSQKIRLEENKKNKYKITMEDMRIGDSDVKIVLGFNKPKISIEYFDKNIPNEYLEDKYLWLELYKEIESIEIYKK